MKFSINDNNKDTLKFSKTASEFKNINKENQQNKFKTEEKYDKEYLENKIFKICNNINTTNKFSDNQTNSKKRIFNFDSSPIKELLIEKKLEPIKNNFFNDTTNNKFSKTDSNFKINSSVTKVCFKKGKYLLFKYILNLSFKKIQRKN